jgi:replication-associated recombination protein RarA
MNELLIHKYRPVNINQLLLSENNKNLVTNFITNNYFNLIFEGSSGCGKSSLINIILQEYYKGNNKIIETNVCYISLLKDQGINFYKNEVRIFINNCINNSYKKFIVIEDVEFFSDMIQMYFFELIKNHKNTIYFMLTTSNKLKINNNLLHLLDIIKFEQVTYSSLLDILTHILTKEQINIDISIKKYIIKLSNNSINNLINNIEKIILLYNNFASLKDVKELDIESNIVIEHYDELIDYCINNKKQEAVDFMLNLLNKGYSIIDILENFLYYIKEVNKFIIEEKKYLIIKLIVNFINNYFSIEEDNIQIIFFTNHLFNIIINDIES